MFHHVLSWFIMFIMFYIMFYLYKSHCSAMKKVHRSGKIMALLHVDVIHPTSSEEKSVTCNSKAAANFGTA